MWTQKPLDKLVEAVGSPVLSCPQLLEVDTVSACLLLRRKLLLRRRLLLIRRMLLRRSLLLWRGLLLYVIKGQGWYCHGRRHLTRLVVL